MKIAPEPAPPAVELTAAEPWERDVANEKAAAGAAVAAAADGNAMGPKLSFAALLALALWWFVHAVSGYRPPDRAKLAEIAAINADIKARVEQDTPVSKSFTAHFLHEICRIRHPCEPFRLWWDRVLTVILLYSLMSIPVRACLEVGAVPLAWDWWLDLAVDIYFLIDIATNFWVGFILDDVYITDRSRIARSYLSCWFWIDLLTSLPITSFIEVVTLGMAEPASAVVNGTVAAADGSLISFLRVPRMLRIVRIARLLKLLRLIKLAKLMSNWGDDGGDLSLAKRLGKLLGIVFFIAHLCGCAYCFCVLVNVNPDTGALPVNSWMASVDNRNVPGTTWVNESDVDKGRAYLLALYWALPTLTTVGYGDMGGKTTHELVWACIVIYIGTVAFGYIIGMVTSVVMSEDRVTVTVRDNIEGIASYLRSRKTSHSLRERIREFFDNRWKTNTVFNEREILNDMPIFLRDEAVQEAYGPMVKGVPVLSRLPPSMLSTLVLRMTPERVMPTQLVIRQGDIGTHMYIVTDGLLREIVGAYAHAPFLPDRSSFKQVAADLPGVFPNKRARLQAAGKFVDDEGTALTLLGRGDHFAECVSFAFSLALSSARFQLRLPMRLRRVQPRYCRLLPLPHALARTLSSRHALAASFLSCSCLAPPTQPFVSSFLPPHTSHCTETAFCHRQIAGTARTSLRSRCPHSSLFPSNPSWRRICYFPKCTT